MEKSREYNLLFIEFNELLFMGGLLGVILQWMKPFNNSLLRIQWSYATPDRAVLK